MNSSLTKDFLNFIRIKICLYVLSLGILGYLLFNNIDEILIKVAITSFLAGVAVYSYNNLYDMEEDLENRKEINPFVRMKNSILIPWAAFFIGFVISVSFSKASIFLYSSGVLLGFIYSKHKFKRFFLIKNIYTYYGVSAIFLMGAVAKGFSLESLYYYLIISLWVFATSIISDLRDIKGDEKINAKTIPIVIGKEKTKAVVISLILLSAFLVLYFKGLLLSFLFLPLILFSLIRDKFNTSHGLFGLLFIILALWMVVSKCMSLML